jgi:hypothetical protein
LLCNFVLKGVESVYGKTECQSELVIWSWIVRLSRKVFEISKDLATPNVMDLAVGFHDPILEEVFNFWTGQKASEPGLEILVNVLLHRRTSSSIRAVVAFLP